MVCQNKITGCNKTSNIEYAKNFKREIGIDGKVYYIEIKSEEEKKDELEEH